MTKHYITRIVIGKKKLPFHLLSRHEDGDTSRGYMIALSFNNANPFKTRVIIFTKEVSEYEWHKESLTTGRKVLIQDAN